MAHVSTPGQPVRTSPDVRTDNAGQATADDTWRSVKRLRAKDAIQGIAHRPGTTSPA
jgi:hypothetical protein